MIGIRLITEEDLPTLRRWRNENKTAFFYNKPISSRQHTKWFSSYIRDQYSLIFIVYTHTIDNNIGCMGIRLLNGAFDIYNVMLGEKEFGGKGLMSMALGAMIRFVRNTHGSDIPIMAKVLINNPAIKWYQKNKFVITETYADHVDMKYEGKL